MERFTVRLRCLATPIWAFSPNRDLRVLLRMKETQWWVNVASTAVCVALLWDASSISRDRKAGKFVSSQEPPRVETKTTQVCRGGGVAESPSN